MNPHCPNKASLALPANDQETEDPGTRRTVAPRSCVVPGIRRHTICPLAPQAPRSAQPAVRWPNVGQGLALKRARLEQRGQSLPASLGFCKGLPPNAGNTATYNKICSFECETCTAQTHTHTPIPYTRLYLCKSTLHHLTSHCITTVTLHCTALHCTTVHYAQYQDDTSCTC